MSWNTDAGYMTPSRKTRSYTLWSVPSSPGRSFLHFKVASKVFSIPAPIMTPFLWTLQTIFVCLSTSRSAHHHKGGRDWSRLSKLFDGNCHLSQVFRNRPNIKLVGRRTLTTWEWRSGYKRTILQHPEATWRTLGDEVHSSRFSSQTIPSQTFKPGE